MCPLLGRQGNIAHGVDFPRGNKLDWHGGAQPERPAWIRESSPLRRQRSRPAARRRQRRSSPPVPLGIRLDVALPGDLEASQCPQVQCLVVDAPDIAAGIHDRFHLRGHATSPELLRRMFRRGLSMGSSLTLP
jgi:hypothetical protein